MVIRKRPLQSMRLLVACMYDLIEFKIPVLALQAHVNEKLAFSKTSTLGAVFENLDFRCPKTAFLFEQKAETNKKISVPRNVRIRVDGA